MIQVSLSIRIVSCAEIFSSATWPGLLSEYSQECSIPMIGNINPQPQIYEAMEKAGVLKCFGAFVDGILVGCATVLLPVLPHYGKKVATVESLFVSKQYRSGGVGSKMMRAIEDISRSTFGCDAILFSAPAGGALEKVLSSDSRYTLTNSVFCRSLV